MGYCASGVFYGGLVYCYWGCGLVGLFLEVDWGGFLFSFVCGDLFVYFVLFVGRLFLFCFMLGSLGVGFGFGWGRMFVCWVYLVELVFIFN